MAHLQRIEQIEEFRITLTASHEGMIPKWNNTTGRFDWVPIIAGINLGVNHDNAYYGDLGKIAYDHSQLTTGNPHSVTKTEVGLSNVTNNAQWYSDNHPTTTTGYGLPDYPTTLPANDVYTWAKQTTKPAYSYSEISGTVPGAHDPVTLATNSGLALSTQVLNMGTPSNITPTTTNSVTTNTHTHAITAGLGWIGNGSQANEILVTGITPFSPTWTLATNLISLNALTFASTSFVKMSAVGTFGLDTNTYLTSVTAHNLLSTIHGDTLADTVVRGDILIGNSTPKWSRLALPVSPTGKILQLTATDVTWSANSLTIGTNASVSGSNTGDQTLAGLGGQAALNGTGFIKINRTAISYDNSTYLTSLSGAVLTDQTTPQTIGTTGARMTKIWVTDITCTNAIAASITGTAAKATNLVGGNNTILLGGIPYQSNTDTTTLLAPNTTTTKKFLSQTGTGTNGATPTWTTVAVSDLTYLLNDEWLKTYDYAGNVANLIKLSKDNITEFANPVGIDALYHVLNSGFNDIVNIPVDIQSVDNTVHGIGITIGGVRMLTVSRQSDGAGGTDTPVSNLVGLIEALPFEFRDLTPGTSQTYELDLYAFYGYTVEGIVLEVDTGTLTDVHIKIGSTDITSLTTLTVDTSRDYTVATGANIVVVSNNVVLVTNTSYTGAPTLIRGSLKIKRT